MRGLMLLLSFVMASNALAAERVIERKGSEIVFTFTQMKVPVQGRFEKFSGVIDFDAAKPEASSVTMMVEVGSISAGEDTDAEAVKPEWLSAKKFPQAMFVSKSIRSLGGGRYEASGRFSLKGLSHDLVVPFDLHERVGAAAEVNGQFVLKRSEYQIGEGEWSAFDVVADDVRVKFHLVLGAAVAKPSIKPLHRSRS